MFSFLMLEDFFSLFNFDFNLHYLASLPQWKSAFVFLMAACMLKIAKKLF